jgi:hypothetical protein
LQLAGNLVEKCLDLAGRRTGFGAQALTEHFLLIAIAEPGLHRTVGQQRNDDRDEQRGEVFPKQRPPRPGRRRSVADAHSTTSSAREIITLTSR